MTDAGDVADLVLRERQSRDRGWWDEWSRCFAGDSSVDMSWFTGTGAEFVRQTRLRSADGVWGSHRLSPPAVRVNGDRACAELPLEIEFRLAVGGVAADLFSYCRSQYRARKAEGVWLITGITSLYERDTLTPSVPGTRLEVDTIEFAAYRPSYRCLGWYLTRDGSDIFGDLAGDDRPTKTAALYTAEQNWLDGIPTGNPTKKEH